MDDLPQLVARARDPAVPPRERNEAFARIVRRFQDMAYACAFSLLRDRHLAEDAAQEAFLTAWRELERLHDAAAFPAWFRRIVTRQCGRHTRRRAHAIVDLNGAGELPAPLADPHAAAELAELRERVLAAVSELPERERTAVTLFYGGDCSQKQVAAFLDLPLTTVQKRLFTARKRLRLWLSDLQPERTLVMVQDDLQANRPSRDDRFERAIKLFNAVAMGDAEQVAALLKEDGTLAAATGRGQWGDRAPLHLAAEQGRTEIARLLLEAGADVHARDQGDNATPLHWAAGSAHMEIAELLIDRGADLNAADDMHERGPLGWAVCLGEYRPEVAAYLIARGARPDLFAAIALDRADLVRKQVDENPACLSTRMSVCEDFQGPAHFAVSKDRPQMLALLAELGADLALRSPSGRTPLCVAVEQKKPDLADWLLARGIEVDLLAAIAMDREERALALLGEPWTQEELDQALLAASQHGRLNVAERLLELGANPNAVGRGDWLRGTSPLILALNDNHPDVARLLIERGADARCQDEYPGATPLHWAAWHGNAELAGLLLDRGADLAQKDRMFDADAVGWAAENGKSDTIDFLLERGASIDISRAAFFGKLDLVRRMLDADPALLNFRGGYGTALHQAALHGHREIVELLLERGADLTVPNRHGDTVLTVVRKAQQGLVHPSRLPAHLAIEALLLQHGAAE